MNLYAYKMWPVLYRGTCTFVFINPRYHASFYFDTLFEGKGWPTKIDENWATINDFIK